MPVVISLATASVRISGRDVPLSGHTLALALYLAAQGRPVSRAHLAGALFASHSAAANTVKVYVHRLRCVIGKDCIMRRAGGYAYSQGVQVDLPEIEAFIARAEAGLRTPLLRARAWQMLRALSSERPEAVSAWHWFAPVEQRLQSARSRLCALYQAEAV